MKGNVRTGSVLFLIGLFSVTQIRIVGSIGISELFIFAAAPIVLIQDYAQLRKHGFLPVVWISILLVVNCVVSGLVNGTLMPMLFRGIATTYAVFSTIVVMHRLLVRNLSQFKWLMLGFALSSVINVFVFQTATETAIYAGGLHGADATQAIMSGPLFWIGRLRNLLSVPTSGWYLQTPLWYSVLSPIALVMFAMLTSESGRSASLALLLSALLILIGRKSVRTMRLMQKRFILVGTSVIMCALLFKEAYQYAAEHGYLTEKAIKKYESQSRGGTGVLRLLMAGRVEFFSGLFANVKKPLWGYGPWAIDRDNLHLEFLREYGSEEDFKDYASLLDYEFRVNGGVGHLIPAHSMIMGFWTWYGIMGLVFWVYVLYLMLAVVRKYIKEIPQLYGYFALLLPSMFWHILFSPFGSRTERMTFVVLLLIAKAVGERRLQLPAEFALQLCERRNL